MLENAFLQLQLIVLNRLVKRRASRPHERVLLVVLTSRLHIWKQVLTIVQPDILLRWHRDLYRWLWNQKSRKRTLPGRPPISEKIVALIHHAARENRTWGAKGIREELLKLGMRVAKSTIQRYIKQVRGPGSSQQTWRSFIHNHASEIWASNILQTYDLFFRAVFVFVISELGKRSIEHFGVTRHSTGKWLAQQLREATPFGAGPRFLIRDNDRKYGISFSRVAFGTDIDALRTPYRSPKANAICERFLGSLQRECLDHFIILSECHLYRIVKEYTRYFNYAHPHQGIAQQIPCQPAYPAMPAADGQVVSFPVLGGFAP